MRREDLENIFTCLPFCNDIKLNVYTQMYKHYGSISNEMKEDLMTYFLIDNIIDVYKNILGSRENMSYYLYNLYNDLIHERYCKYEVQLTFPSLMYNTYVENIMEVTDSLTENNSEFIDSVSSITDKFVLERIRFFWRRLTPEKRRMFYTFMLHQVSMY